MNLTNRFSRSLAGALCLFLSPLPGFGYQAPGGATQTAGSVTALDPAATRNGTSVAIHDQVQWNDELQTSSAGRLRVNLQDGSILSLGSSTQMRVVQHNQAAQQTTLELLFGRLRSQVVKLTQSNSKFEVRTPTSVAGVIGTDFLVIATADRTTVIVYSGIVQVTPLNGAGGTPNQSQSVNVNPGQQVETTASGVGPVTTIAPQVLQQLMQQTAVSHAGLATGAGVAVKAGSHVLRTVLITLGAVTAGAVTGVVIAKSGGNSPAPAPQTPSTTGTPPR